MLADRHQARTRPFFSKKNINGLSASHLMSRVKRRKPRKADRHKEPEKKRMSKQMIMTIIIGGLMILSVFGIMFSSFNSGSEQKEYGDYRFQRVQTGWTADIGGKRAEFTFHPSDLEDLNMSDEVIDRLKVSRVVYVTFDPESEGVGEFELARFGLSQALAGLFDIYVMPGVSTPHEDYDQPLVDCSNATAMVPVVSFVGSNRTAAYLEGDCVVLEADEYSAPVIKDRLLYGMLGIIE